MVATARVPVPCTNNALPAGTYEEYSVLLPLGTLPSQTAPLATAELLEV